MEEEKDGRRKKRRDLFSVPGPCFILTTIKLPRGTEGRLGVGTKRKKSTTSNAHGTKEKQKFIFYPARKKSLENHTDRQKTGKSNRQTDSQSNTSYNVVSRNDKPKFMTS